MIVHIHGILVEKSPSRAVIEAAGLGYEVLIPLSTFDRLPATGEETKLFTCHVVKEDEESLYGFASKSESGLFRLLTQVSGVGPKIALAILSGSSTSELALAITSSNAKRISAIKGVGKKTAEKICIELKDKINNLEAIASAGRQGQQDDKIFLRDACLALTALGFTEEIAAKMVAKAIEANPEAKDTESVVRLALKSSK